MPTSRISFPTFRTSAGALAVALSIGGLGAVPTAALAQVTYFAKPPTPEQLRAALLAPASTATGPTHSTAAASTIPAMGQAGSTVATPATAAALPGGTRTRGIVWNTGASPAGSATATATGSATGSAAASAAAPLPPAGARMQAPTQMTASAPAAALPINFDLGSSRIESSSLPYLETIASVLRTDPSLQLVIEGHTDDRGSYNRNMVLSWDRALGVFRTLVENYGIDPKRLQPVGKGPLEPMPGTSPADGANRRVQFRISG